MAARLLRHRLDHDRQSLPACSSRRCSFDGRHRGRRGRVQHRFGQLHRGRGPDHVRPDRHHVRWPASASRPPSRRRCSPCSTARRRPPIVDGVLTLTNGTQRPALPRRLIRRAPIVGRRGDGPTEPVDSADAGAATAAPGVRPQPPSPPGARPPAGVARRRRGGRCGARGRARRGARRRGHRRRRRQRRSTATRSVDRRHAAGDRRAREPGRCRCGRWPSRRAVGRDDQRRRRRWAGRRHRRRSCRPTARS